MRMIIADVTAVHVSDTVLTGHEGECFRELTVNTYDGEKVELQLIALDRQSLSWYTGDHNASVDLPTPACQHCGEPGPDFYDMNGNAWHSICHREFVREYNKYYDETDSGDDDQPPPPEPDGTDSGDDDQPPPPEPDGTDARPDDTVLQQVTETALGRLQQQMQQFADMCNAAQDQTR